MVDKRKMDSDDDPKNDDRFYPPSPKWSRVNEDSSLSEAVLAYAAIVRDADDVRTIYQQAIKQRRCRGKGKWNERWNSKLIRKTVHGGWP